MESTLLIKHVQECKSVTPEKHEVKPKQEQLVQERDDNNKEDQHSKEVAAPTLSSLRLNLKLEIPQLKEEDDDEEGSNDGFKTPTSEEHKIPPMLQCPGAPRKRKTSPMKQEGCRRRHHRRPIVLDFTTQEIESAMPLPVDLGAGGNNNNKDS
ncbi:hypothetical protein RIF29_32047 [Crotalaria pallida]|uniref:Uncharacterized protein n=1 Tax=Crotalaria pallida TaxID=3830 RepID=A0AAN9EPX9_CROPI